MRLSSPHGFLMSSIKLLRWLDLLVGLPACSLLTVVRRLVDLGGRTTPTPPRSVVFIKLVEQGSTVLAYSALRRAIDRVGKQNVYFLVFEENRFILDAMEMIEPANVLAIRNRGAFTFIADMVRALATLRRRRVDAAIDLEFFARGSAALAWLSGCATRVGFHASGGEGPYRGDLLTHRLRYNPYLHTADIFRLLVEALEMPAGLQLPLAVVPSPPSHAELPPQVSQTDTELVEVSGLIQDALKVGKCSSLILLNPNCSDILPLRRWPESYYVELARQLIARYPHVHVAVTGAPAECSAAEAFVRRVDSPRCFSLAGRTTLRQLLVLYCMAEILVTNDSGPAHFATLTPIDVVTLFGPETPHLFAARSPRNHVFWRSLACSPCVSAFNQRFSSCRDNICMQQISVAEVFAKVCEIYDRRMLANPAFVDLPAVGRRATGT